MRKLIFRNHQSPGDILMLTAAVRDLQISSPGRFAVDVRTSCGPLWEHNPHLTKLPDEDGGVEQIDCCYPMVHRSNQQPFHFIHAFHEFIGEQLGVRFHPTAFKGDIHLAADEKRWISQVQEITREPVPFWIIVAGGKKDYTAKWWDHDRYQAVVDHFRGRILFVQTGEARHVHRPLRGAINLLGKTNLRQFVRLMYHAQGVLAPVTFAMHLAAAVETRPGQAKLRPCVVVAGGREPVHWEAYPGHQFIHTIGALPCCAGGGCWKARAVPLGDGDEKDQSLCVRPIGHLPQCMDMIPAAEVIRRISMYFEGGAARYLTPAESKSAHDAILRTAFGGGDQPLGISPQLN